MEGWLLCDGAQYNVADYPALAATLGATGETFQVPDMRGRTLWGANGNLGATIEAGLPNATGTLSAGLQAGKGIFTGGGSGALYNNYSEESTDVFSLGTSTIKRSADDNIRLSLARSNPIYGRSSTVQPPAVAVNFFIKH